MTITVNGKEFTDGFNRDGTPKPLENKPRLKWSEIGRFAGIDPRRFTNNATVRVTVGTEKPRQHLHGHSLILVDGMSIMARV